VRALVPGNETAAEERVLPPPRRFRLIHFRIGVIFFAVVALVAVSARFFLNLREQADVYRIAILVPDSVSASDPQARIWTDAGHEEGIIVEVVSDSRFLAPLARSSYAALILPDEISRRSSDPIVTAVRDYASRGGTVLIVYDALSANSSIGNTTLTAAEGLSGVQIRRDSHGTPIKTPAAVAVPEGVSLELQPGKLVGDDGRTPAGATASRWIATYKYGKLRYPVMALQPQASVTTLLERADRAPAAVSREFGRGRIFFVGLPLGYLAGHTDGALLHAFLLFLANESALPRLLAVPSGIGGLIMNWHIDSQASLKPVEALASAGIYAQGPYSVHLTAGPDVDPGDGLGLDLPHNDAVRAWLMELKRRGYSIGSHGGWIHNYFGLYVTETNEREFAPFLTRNFDAIERVIGGKVTEYSAPNGNQPIWVSGWLERHGVLGYYFVGDVGLGPTRPYREGWLSNERIWAFPIASRGTDASFEDMARANVSDVEAGQWLEDLTEFAADHRVARMVYFHPPGAVQFPVAMQRWLGKAWSLSQQHRFRWYTMSRVAGFLDRREAAHWQLTAVDSHTDLLRAESDSSLAELTWTLPKRRYLRPLPIAGAVTVNDAGSVWLLTSGSGHSLSIRLPRTAPDR
jgi:hypothetical protein